MIDLDQTEVAWVHAADLGEARPLTALLGDKAPPAAGWYALEVLAGKKRLYLPEPAKRYAGQEVRLYRGAGGAVSLGLFRAGAAQPTMHVDGVKMVKVETHAPSNAGQAAASGVVLAVKGAPEREVSAAELAALPAVGGRDSQWRLADVVGLAIAPGKVAWVVVVGEEDRRAELSGAELVSVQATPVLRRNGRGTLRLGRLGEKGRRHGGAGAAASAPIRAVSRVEIEPR